ncbi:Receptor-like kinase TMK4 [Linum perenne]
MGEFLIHLFLIFFFFFFFFFPIITTGDDASVILKLAKSITPLPSGWSSTSSKNLCQWKGIQCDDSSSNTKVTSITLSNLGLTGILPSEISTLTQLRNLALQNNKLQGPLPSLSKLSNLQSLSLDNNNFTSIPTGFFKGLINLQSLSISSNLGLPPWLIPSQDLSTCSALVSFVAHRSNLFGSIPDMFGSLVSLQNLKLSYNNLTGPLPPSMAKSSIQNLWLNNQEVGLSGSLQVLSQMSQLSQAWVQNNKFSGPIPDLSKCENLFDLQLRDNQLTGVVPINSLASLSRLRNVSLSNNKLQGPIPVFPSRIKVVNTGSNNFCVATPGVDCSPQVKALLEVAQALGYPSTLSEKWLGNDPCSSWSYVTCDPRKENVTTFNMGKQGFVGRISPAFSQLSSLQFLYLNDNNLTGSIPDTLTSLSQLKVFDLSNNNLSGRIPVFSPSVKITLYPGNRFLGFDVDTGVAGEPSSSSSTGAGDDVKQRSSNLSIGVIVAIAISILFFVAALLMLLLLRYKKKKKEEDETGDVEGNFMFGKGKKKKEWYISSDELHGMRPKIFGGNEMKGKKVLEDPSTSISIEVLKQITDNFSEKKILGKGGFGVVYKGDLHDGSQVAVKRMDSGVTGIKGMKEFEAEIGVLSNVRHRHLVAFLGYCINERERLLVYEYMSHGTLGQHLFEWRRMGILPLTWKQRLSIALDVARGVEYLHSLAQQSFIHRDLKPSNILLGDNMRAKVSDFGLVKHATDGKQSMETRLAGTFGYLAPEYATTGRVSRKVDVYAFGVILMEMITGRKALDESMEDETGHLVTWFRMMMNNGNQNIQMIMDVTLTIHKQDKDYESTIETVDKVAELAGHCTIGEPSQRPEMGHVVNVLAPLVEQWTPLQQQQQQQHHGVANHSGEEHMGFGIDLYQTLPEALQRWQAEQDFSTTFTHDSAPHQSDSDHNTSFQESRQVYR